jgi:hypothetical protein
MAVSVVNGYVCFSSCDVAQAKQNKDPNVPPGAAHERPKSSALAGQPATILDGALKNLASAVSATSGTDHQARLVDRLA